MARPGRVAVVVAAAGRGERLGGEQPKALRDIAGTPMLVHTVRSLSTPAVDLVVVAAPPDSVDTVRELLPVGTVVIPGGASRPESVRCALAALPDDVDVVLVHDAARPFVPVRVIEAVVAGVRSGHVAVVPVIPVADTVKRMGPDGRILETLDRDGLYAAQTPQGFRRDVLVAAHRDEPATATDDAVLVESAGHPVWSVPGAQEAFKVTHPVDLLLAELLLAGRDRG